MKKSLFIILLTLMTTLTLTAAGQTKTPQRTEQEVKTLLCQKWQLTHMEAQGQRVPLPPEMGQSFMTLNSDGTFTESSGEERSEGKWAYEHKAMTLSTDDRDGKEKHKIVKITTDQLILKTQYEGMPMNMILKRVKG